MDRKKKIIGLIFVLSLATLACGLDLGGPAAAPTPTATPSIADAKSFVEAWDQAFSIAKDTGEVSLKLSEDQVSSFFAIYIANQENPILTNPQVDLRDGQMEILGTYDTGSINANVGIVLEVTVDDNGSPRIEVVSGSLGLLPLPVELLQGIAEVANEVLTGELSTTATGFKLEAIVITEDDLEITGKLN